MFQKAGQMLALFAVIVGACEAARYVPGTPGAPWTEQEQLMVRAKLRHMYHRSTQAPKALRLGFHDCLRYADGSGGCDGCLNWKNVDVKLNSIAHARNLTDHVETDNNGLGDIVRNLEKLYTKKAWPRGTGRLAKSLRDSGKSRADLWAFASMVAVEWGIDSNNIACDDQTDRRLTWGHGKGTCVHDTDPYVCKLQLPRNFVFKTGRKDCVEVGNKPYKAARHEKHPSYLVNGRDTVKFFKDEFNFTSRETVAIFGAHTYGKPHFDVSQIPYTWTSRAIFLFNNDYYKSLTGQDRWYINDDDCNKMGDAFGTIPKTKWVAHTRMTSFNGGPTFWIHFNHACPNCVTTPDQSCCTEKEPQNMCKVDPVSGGSTPRLFGEEDGDNNRGCERLRLISGADEVALNCEMGLYLDFEVDNGVLYGCPGLDVFNKTMNNPDAKHTVWSKNTDNGRGWDQPACGKTMVAEPAGSTPTYMVMEEYANDQALWINDFQLAMEKMLSNGYADEELELAPALVNSLNCTFDHGHKPQMVCFPAYPELDHSMYFTISSAWNELSGQYMTMNATSGASKLEPANPTLSNQMWVFNANHDMIYNVDTMRPLAVHGNIFWRTVDEDSPSGAILLDLANKAVDCYGARNGHSCSTWKKHGAAWQRFLFTPLFAK